MNGTHEFVYVIAMDADHNKIGISGPLNEVARGAAAGWDTGVGQKNRGAPASRSRGAMSNRLSGCVFTV